MLTYVCSGGPVFWIFWALFLRFSTQNYRPKSHFYAFYAVHQLQTLKPKP